MIRKIKAATAVVGVLCSSVLLLAPAVSLAGDFKLQNVVYEIASKELVVKAKLDGFDGPTAASVVDSEGAVLASGSATRQVLFRIPYDSIFDVPCDVTFSAGGKSTPAEVKNCAGPGQTYEIVLSGIVTDEPIPDATVSVTLDGVTYTTTADGSGVYSLPIISANLNQLVRIDAEGTSGSGEPIEFTSLTGTFSRVLDGDASGNVTNVTTASYVLTVEANGGTEPTTAEELSTAETSVDATELFKLAALIKLIVDSPPGSGYSVPEGQSLLEFISDPVAVETYLESVPQEDLNSALAEILADADLVAGFTADEIPERYYAIPVAEPGFIARQGRVLQFEATGGVGAIIDTGINQPFTWEIDELSRLVITPDTPVESETFPSIDEAPLTAEERQTLQDAGISQILAVQSDKRYAYTRVTDGTLVDIVRIEVLRDVTYPPVDLGGGNELVLATSFEPDVTGSSESTLRSSLDIEPTPFTDACPGGGQSVCAKGVWVGEFYSPDLPWWDAAGDLLTLNEDTSITRTLGGDLPSWAVDADGRLVMSFSDGWTQSMEILDELDGEYGIFSEFRDASGSLRFGIYTVYARADVKPVLTDAANIPGKYYNGEINSWIPGSFYENGLHTPDRRFGWQLNADGSGERRLGFPTGVEGSSCTAGALLDPMSWQLRADGAIQLSYSVPNDFVPGGRLYRIRTWYTVAEKFVDVEGDPAGDRVLYVLETDQFDFGEFNQPLAFAPRMNIQREIPLQGDFCQEWIFDRTNGGPAIRPE